MGETVMSATTQMYDLIRKEDQINERRAALISEVILGRIQNKTLNESTETDILNMIKEIPDEFKITVLTRALVLVGMNNVKTSRNFDEDRFEPRKKVKNRSDIFGRYDE